MSNIKNILYLHTKLSVKIGVKFWSKIYCMDCMYYNKRFE